MRRLADPGRFTAVQAALSADPGVVKAQGQLTTEAATVTTDETALQADYVKLFQDLKAPATGTTTAPIGTPITLAARK